MRATCGSIWKPTPRIEPKNSLMNAGTGMPSMLTFTAPPFSGGIAAPLMPATSVLLPLPGISGVPLRCRSWR